MQLFLKNAQISFWNIKHLILKHKLKLKVSWFESLTFSGLYTHFKMLIFNFISHKNHLIFFNFRKIAAKMPYSITIASGKKSTQLLIWYSYCLLIPNFWISKFQLKVFSGSRIISNWLKIYRAFQKHIVFIMLF